MRRFPRSRAPSPSPDELATPARSFDSGKTPAKAGFFLPDNDGPPHDPHATTRRAGEDYERHAREPSLTDDGYGGTSL